MDVSSPKTSELDGKVAIVTGAAKGIGRGIALRLATAGARVLVTDTDPVLGQETADLAWMNGASLFLQTDVSDPSDAARSVDLCFEKWGRLDILVNNTGAFVTTPILDASEALWDTVFALNVKGTLFHSQAAARRMVAAGTGGSIVNIASIDAFHPTRGHDASKGALVTMTQSLAAELGRYRIRVNAVVPGAVATPGTEAMMKAAASEVDVTTEQLVRGLTDRIPLGRLGTSDEVARAVLFLAGPGAEYITGTTVVVDGGLLLT